MNQIPKPVLDATREIIGKSQGEPVSLMRYSPTGGGCINRGGRLGTAKGDLFIKWNRIEGLPGMFISEEKGLDMLRAAGAIRIPRVIGTGERGGWQFIVMEFIPSASRASGYWELLGEQLAGLHRIGNAAYGLTHDNYMGSLHQFNAMRDSWVDFFIEQRLQVQLKLGIDNGRIDRLFLAKFERLYQLLPSLLIGESPSLVHGDLWGGNLIVDDKGEPCLIDPAVYYGHREIDLAMTQLFGRFETRFYDVYNEVFPTAPGLQDRLDIYNLYPLLVHVNLFGQSYLHPVNSTLDAFLK